MKEDGGMLGQQRIVSIVGFGGLGKTTLAKAVYDKLKPQFNCNAFVSVSRDPDVIKVFKDLLYGFDKITYKDIHSTALGQQHLTDHVQEFLNDKRYVPSWANSKNLSMSSLDGQDYSLHVWCCQ
jgi:disease resistance protein RPM1